MLKDRIDKDISHMADERGNVADRIVILLSGGLDSTTALALYECMAPSPHSVCALSFQYGQAHVGPETQAATFIARHYNVQRHEFIPLHCLGNSKLIPNPPGAATADAGANDPRLPVTGGTHIAETFVPGRNLLFLAIAAIKAVQFKASTIIIGANQVDYSGYPDCRAGFLCGMEDAINLAMGETRHGQRLHIVAPLLFHTKLEIVQLARKLEVPIELTHSCYFPTEEGLACHECPSCLIREKAIQQADEASRDAADGGSANA